MSTNLPEIKSKTLTNFRNGDGYRKAPFQLPDDDDVFFGRKENPDEKKNLKIWEKKTASTKYALKRTSSTDDDIDNNYKPKSAYNFREKKLIDNALEIIKERQRNKTRTKREGVNGLIDQKKEIFLVTKGHDILQKEIFNLKEIDLKRKKAIKRAMELLQNDHESFNIFLENNKRQADDAQQKAENEGKFKKNRELEYKSLSIKLTSLKAEKSRNEEILGLFKDHKDFLDNLATKTKEKKRQELIDSFKKEWVTAMLDKDEDFLMGTIMKGNIGKDRKTRMPKKNEMTQKQYLEILFEKKVSAGELYKLELDEFEDEYEMFLKTPEELEEIFGMFEEKNLFLIQNTQDIEQNLEELKTTDSKNKETLEAKKRTLTETKEQLKRNLENKQHFIKTVISNSENKASTKIKDEKLGDLKKKMLELYNSFKDDIGMIGDIENKSGLDILGILELYLGKLIRVLKSFTPELVEKYKIKFEKLRQNKEKEERDVIKYAQNEKILEKKKKKMMMDVKKRNGRNIMFRSAPSQKEEIKEDVTSKDNDEEERKFLFSEYLY